MCFQSLLLVFFSFQGLTDLITPLNLCSYKLPFITEVIFGSVYILYAPADTNKENKYRYMKEASNTDKWSLSQWKSVDVAIMCYAS